MSTPLYFDVIGTPAPQGSKRHVGRGIMVESSKAVGPWRETVAAQAVAAARACHWQTPDGAVAVQIVFWLHRPPSAPKKRLRPDRAPDIDKIARSSLDALTTSGVIADDARVVDLYASKHYAPAGHWTGAEFTISDATDSGVA